ncbi:MAG: phytanoyl-CoA dioxygenase family protein, partial [Fimbriimonadaceae bacterium]|nr:phytanoyl-CoA dioxygenase family protein [Fimbriimonadaceae bacterium]
MNPPDQEAGFGHLTAVLSPAEIERLIDRLPSLEGSGSRNLLDLAEFAFLARDPRLIGRAEEILEADCRPVRGILFDKTPGRNWGLGWHQDTKIAVKPTEIRPEGWSGWSMKEGVLHAAPPAEVLDRCVALRLHLDPAGPGTGGLRVIPG